MIPGIDGIGRDPDGQLRYFILADTHLGSMAEQVVIDPRRSVPLPASTDILTVAAVMNPAMSSWIALRNRIAFEPGQNVLVLGATGNAGQMAVQIAKRLGARRVIAAGRDPGRLATLTELGADSTISLAGDPDSTDRAIGQAAAEAPRARRRDLDRDLQDRRRLNTVQPRPNGLERTRRAWSAHRLRPLRRP
jgi:NADPH:quinone reductase-like Zn-dependent oxidoreductase